MSETATKPGREFYMRSNPRYLQCEILVDQDQRIKNTSHRTILAKTPDGLIFMACQGMGTWCEADFTDFANWTRLVRDNPTKIRNCHRMDLIEHFKWNIRFYGASAYWRVATGYPEQDVSTSARTYIECLNICIVQAMQKEYEETLRHGASNIPPTLLQAMVNQIRWRNQHNPALPDPAWMNQL